MKYNIGGINKRVEVSKKRKRDTNDSHILQIFHVPHYTRIKKYYSHISNEELSFVSNCINKFDAISLVSIEELKLNPYWSLSNIEQIHADFSHNEYKEPMLLSSMLLKVHNTKKLDEALNIINIVGFTDDYFQKAFSIRFSEDGKVDCNQQLAIVNILFHTYYTKTIEKSSFLKFKTLITKHKLSIDLKYIQTGINLCVKPMIELKKEFDFEEYFKALLNYSTYNKKDLPEYFYNMLENIHINYENSENIKNGIYNILQCLDNNDIDIKSLYSKKTRLDSTNMLYYYIVTHYKINSITELYLNDIKQHGLCYKLSSEYVINKKIEESLYKLFNLKLCKLYQIFNCINEQKYLSIQNLEKLFFKTMNLIDNKNDLIESKNEIYKILEKLTILCIEPYTTACKNRINILKENATLYLKLDSIFKKYDYLNYLNDLKTIREQIRNKLKQKSNDLPQIYTEFSKTVKYQVLFEEWYTEEDFFFTL